MVASAHEPVEINLDRDRELRIRWADGGLSVLPLTTLRHACPCASCRTKRHEQAAGSLPVVQPLAAQHTMARAKSVELVGRYAVRIIWQDGHSTGIYDYTLLRSLCPPQGR